MTLAQRFEEKGREEVAKRMLAKGLDIQLIAEMTGLSVARINRLKNKES